MSHDRHSRLSGIFLKEGFWTDPRRSEDKSQNDNKCAFARYTLLVTRYYVRYYVKETMICGEN